MIENQLEGFKVKTPSTLFDAEGGWINPPPKQKKTNYIQANPIMTPGYKKLYPNFGGILSRAQNQQNRCQLWLVKHFFGVVLVKVVLVLVSINKI